MTWTAWIAGLVVAYVPGALLCRIPAFDRPFRARLSAEERAFWGVVLSVACSLTIVIGLALLGRYTFARLVGIDLGLSAIVLLGWRGRLRYGGEARRVTASALAPVAIAALGIWLFFPPAEYIIGGRDPGAYLNEGVQIAQRGEIVLHDAVISSIPTGTRSLFFPARRSQRDVYYGVRFMGFFIQNPDEGSVVGQFPHLFPASVAIGYALHGLTGARQAIGVWAILGLLAVYFTAVRLLGQAPAAAAAALLAINVITIWFSRYPNSEIPMQALLFAALLGFGRALDGGRSFFGVIAAALLGLMLFLRYDALIAICVSILAAALAPAARGRVGVAFGIVLAAVSALGFRYLLGPLRAYAAYPLAFMKLSAGWWLVSGGILGAILVRFALGRQALVERARRSIPPAYVLVIVPLAAYAYFLRVASGRTADFDAMSFRVFGWYVTSWGLLAAVAGLSWLALRRFWRAPAFFLVVATFGVFFFYKTRIVPEHFWTARRFLAVILPGALIGVAGIADAAARALLARVRGAAAAPALMAVLLAPLGLVFWQTAAPVRAHTEYAGLIPHVERLASAIGNRDLLVVESRNAGSDLHVLAVPLAYIYGRQVLVLASVTPPKRQLERFLGWAWTRYDHVLFLGGGGTDLLSTAFTAEPLLSDRFSVPEYNQPINAFPSGIRRKDFEFSLFRIDRRASGTRLPLDVRIGVLDDLNVLRFYARERRGDTGELFRWTTGQSFVLLLGMPPSTTEVVVWMSSGGRPARAPAPAVEVALDDRVLGTATPDDAVRPYRFPVPPDLVARLAASPDAARLRLRVPTWNPAAIIGGSDTRDLGVIVTRVETR